MNLPWSDLLTRRMLAQGKEWSNARHSEFGWEERGLGVSESHSEDREKIPGLVLATAGKAFVNYLLSLDNRGLNKRTRISVPGASLA
jgi:hypothetical protein